MSSEFEQTKEQLIKNNNLISAVILLKKEKDKTYVLLNERRKGKWEMPGGKVESGEKSKEAAIREIKEETNIDINPKKLITIEEMSPEYKTNKRCNYYGYFVDNNQEINAGSDAKNLKWFPVDNLPPMLWNGSEFVQKTFKKMASKKDDIFIFVDIDGVLNKNNEKEKEKYYQNVYNLKEIILKDKVELLNTLYDELNPTFVLSSYWRKFGSLHVFNKLFKDLGFKGEFSLSTPFEGIEHWDRWKQIKKILKKYKPEKYIIFDDKSLNREGTFDTKNLIHTNENTGLTKKDIDEAFDLLNFKKATFNLRKFINTKKEN